MERPPSVSSATDAALLRAAREEILALGLRRASVTSVARRAGVSRVTVYRRAGGLEQLVLDTMSGEFEELASDIAADVVAGGADRPARDLIVDALLSMVRRLKASELVLALVQHDPELMIPYLARRLGRSQRSVIDIIEQILTTTRDDSVRSLDPKVAAHTLLFVLEPFVLSQQVVADTGLEEEIESELALVLHGYLHPGLGETTAPLV